MTWSAMAGFVVAVALGAMVPGPTTALVIRRSALGGGRVTVPVILGMEVGLYAWALASAVGLSALVKASETAYTALRIAGAIVLVFLGVQAWLASRHVTQDASLDGTTSVPRKWWQPATAGLLTNLANPKIAVFAFAFYPQFIPAGANVLTSTLLLGVIHVAIDAGWFLLVATFVGKTRKLFSRAKIRRRLERITGTVLIGLGASLAFEKL